ncbi:MAG: glycoside hydrolase family 99-like domain-containing protein [Dysgonamonadaceae bacterium]|jgi:hypothetical protein|nr:glycoside hydrolase family 99-like domain-containing protein [Dysgonamonadaceae bacterium]
MKKYKYLFCLLIIGLPLFISCTEDGGPSIDDHFLNYEIPDVPVKENCVLGAYYIDPGSGGIAAAVWERLTNPVYDPSNQLYGPTVMPVLGNWAHSNVPLNNIVKGEELVGIFQQQVDWAIQAGLDFLIMPIFGEDANRLYPLNVNQNTLRFINLFTGRSGSDGLPVETSAGSHVDLKGLKYVLMMNAGNFTGSLNQSTPIESIAATVIEGQTVSRVERFYEVARRFSDFFSDPNYYAVDNKPMLVIGGTPHNLYALDTKALYDGLRNRMKEASGKDVYIVAQQDAWTPAARFQYTFGDGRVDAVTIKNEGGMYNQTDIGRFRLYPQMIDQNWNYNKNYFLSTWNEDFIPAVSPSFNRWVYGVNYNYPIVERDEKTFVTYCNVAKRNLGTKRIVFIDSFNHWAYNTAIEPADPSQGKGFGEQYLKIVRQQFKVN